MNQLQDISHFIQQQQVPSIFKECWYYANYQVRNAALNFEEIQGEIYIMGQQISLKNVLQDQVEYMLWFTYRKDMFYPINKDAFQNNDVTMIQDDIGWGCMYRVGQMLLANLIKIHISQIFDINIESFEFKDIRKDILEMFSDYEFDKHSNNSAPFSIDKIIEAALKQLQIPARTWHNPNQIMYCLQFLVEKHLSNQMDAKIQLPQFDFFCSFDNIIDLNQLIGKISNCQCFDKKLNFYHNMEEIKQEIKKRQKKTRKMSEFEIVHQEKKMMISQNSDGFEIITECINNNNNNNSEYTKEMADIIFKQIQTVICQECNKNRKDIPVAVNVLSRIGCDQPNELYLEGIRYLMKKPYFSGMIGGRPKQALYFYGLIGEKFAYLDPHFVQTVKQSNLEKYTESCHCKDILIMEPLEIDCSLGMTFYLRSLKDVAYFIGDLLYLKDNDKLFMGFEANRKNYYKVKQKNILSTEQEKQMKQFSERIAQLKKDEYAIII